MSVLSDKLRVLNKPRVILRYKELRFEGVVISCDDCFLELYDDKREYRKFLKISEINDLEVLNEN